MHLSLPSSQPKASCGIHPLLDATMEWERPPLHRHLSTVGIGPVFLRPPPHPLPPPPGEEGAKEDRGDGPESNSTQCGDTVETWEIVGDIKTSPEDFVVREIGWAPPAPGGERSVDGNGRGGAEPAEDSQRNGGRYRRKPGWSRRIAGDRGSEMAAPNTGGKSEPSPEKDALSFGTGAGRESNVGTGVQDREGEMPASKKARTARRRDGLGNSEPSAEAGSPGAARRTEPRVSPRSSAPAAPTPVEGLRRALISCGRGHEGGCDPGSSAHEKGPELAAENVLKQLEELHMSALDEIQSASTSTDCDVENDAKLGAVWIAVADHSGKDDRRMLHKCIRRAFPLLKTESSSEPPGTKPDSGGKTKENVSDPEGGERMDDAKKSGHASNGSWARALVDRAFFPLIPRLSDPLEDLIQLYRFRNDGPVRSSGREGNGCRGSGQRQRNRTKRRREQPEKQECHPLRPTHGEGLVLLRLRPDLPRSERQAMHQLLASNSHRGFDTSTRHDVPLDYCDANSGRTSAIEARWSLNAVRRAARKDQKSNGHSAASADQILEKGSDMTAIFCTLRKHKCEHQVAVKKLSHALRCRHGDVGLAGIKDMQAITYQFCTLRNVGLTEALRANDFLGKRVQLSEFAEVRGFLLDRAMLLGNRFEITMRNMGRVQRRLPGGEERVVPLRASHLDDMVQRVRDRGFVNFYGEQRVGDAGSAEYAGVRSFDIGRAMLRRDFEKAIDLIMRGRSENVHSPGPDEASARRVWKESGGDARATLKAFPKNRNVMACERDAMKGLVRYGDALEAIRCLPQRMFYIHGYQSYIWNKVATERIRRWGLRPVKGDLYLNAVENGSVGEDGATFNVRVINDSKSLLEVSLSQIVLPLPGYNVQYPQNDIGKLYTEILEEDGVELRKGKDVVPEATAKGSYRKLIQRASRLKCDVMAGKDEHATKEDGEVDAARFTFELESGSYATMMLRELMVTTVARNGRSKHEPCSLLTNQT